MPARWSPARCGGHRLSYRAVWSQSSVWRTCLPPCLNCARLGCGRRLAGWTAGGCRTGMARHCDISFAPDFRGDCQPECAPGRAGLSNGPAVLQSRRLPMALASGARLGPYEILSAIGAGGMGEVYRARDARLDRTVAIKVLPPEFSADPDRLARFQREAKTIAGLSHPHICTLHDIGEDIPSGPLPVAPRPLPLSRPLPGDGAGRRRDAD